MCVVSMVMDHYWDKWHWRSPYTPSQPITPLPPGPYIPYVPTDTTHVPIVQPVVVPVSDEEVAEFRRLLERAREYDKRHNEPNCELVEKREKLLKLADELGIKIDFV